MASFFAGLFLCLAVSAADPLPEAAEGTLQLANGGYVMGQILDSDSAAEFAWQGTQFTAPFRFALADIEFLSYPQPTELPKAAGEFCFELSGGDMFYGGLRGVTDEFIEIEETRFGRLSLRRNLLLRFFRNSGRELIYAGPVGLKGWTTESEFWHEDGGHVTTNNPGARLRGDFQLPPRALFEFELSWKKPNFSLGLGTTAGPQHIASGFRLEIVESDLVAIRETTRAADVAVVTPVGPGEGRVQFLAYLDQHRGRLMVYSVTGTLLADLQVPVTDPQVGSGVTLVNLQGDLRLERLRISHWNGSPPAGATGDSARFLPTEGDAVQGRLAEFDARHRALIFQDGERQITRPLDQIQEVMLNAAAESSPASPSVQLIYQDGTRLTGDVKRFGKTNLVIASPAVADAVTAPVAELRRLQSLGARKEATSRLNQRETLELPGTKLRGRLVASTAGPDASCLAWQPDLCETASPLRHGVSGKVVYRVPPPPAPKPSPQANAVNRRKANKKMLDIGKIVQLEAALAKPPSSQPAEKRFLHLRNGDTIPCQVTSIDERGITFETTMSDATFVAHEQIKAVELIKLATTPKIARLKRERLLTLPRMQRDSPPTQLLISPTGDILRGRVLDMTDSVLEVEVRLDVRQLDRRRIAQIIWLHEEELDREDASSRPASVGADSTGKTRVQVQRSDGIRLTYFAEQLDEKMLSGRSDLLGECRTDLSQVDQLLIGDAIEQSAAMLAYHRWKLHHAVDPKFVQEENEGGDSGRHSPLVGKPAPDFTLSRLDGTKFHLSETRGEIVVLEFWATWCGYCMQALPQVAQVVDEFRDAKVRLVAVNLEEAPKQITSTLERHKLDVPVVLDQDGVAGLRYSVISLPHTVIIDREGNVFRVFIGAGDGLAEPLRAALKAATEPPADDAAKAESN